MLTTPEVEFIKGVLIVFTTFEPTPGLFVIQMTNCRPLFIGTKGPKLDVILKGILMLNI